MENNKNYLIQMANKYSVSLQIIEEIFTLMDDWFEEKLIDDISNYPEINKILTNK